MEWKTAHGKAKCRGETKIRGIKDLNFMYVLNWFGNGPNRKNPFPHFAGVFPHHKSIVWSGSAQLLFTDAPAEGKARMRNASFRWRCAGKLVGGSLPASRDILSLEKEAPRKPLDNNSRGNDFIVYISSPQESW